MTNRREPLYQVIAYCEPNDKRLVLAENVPHNKAWQLARKAMNDQPEIYAVSVRAMVRNVGGEL